MGLLPFWAKAKSLQGSTINARIETVATKNSFRAAFKKRRCLVPMEGYYEWSISDVDGKKDPWFIHAHGPLWAAGLWEDTSPLLPDGNLGTFSIITGDSSGVSADIHDRMPVWIDPGQLDARLLSHTATPRQVKPAHCSASVVSGSCRQSVNSNTGAPSRKTRWHCASHSCIHARCERWSRSSLGQTASHRSARASVRSWRHWPGRYCLA